MKITTARQIGNVAKFRPKIQILLELLSTLSTRSILFLSTLNFAKRREQNIHSLHIAHTSEMNYIHPCRSN